MPPDRDYVTDILGTIMRIQFNLLQLFVPSWRDSVDINQIMHFLSMEVTRRYVNKKGQEWCAEYKLNQNKRTVLQEPGLCKISNLTHKSQTMVVPECPKCFVKYGRQTAILGWDSKKTEKIRLGKSLLYVNLSICASCPGSNGLRNYWNLFCKGFLFCDTVLLYLALKFIIP